MENNAQTHGKQWANTWKTMRKHMENKALKPGKQGANTWKTRR